MSRSRKPPGPIGVRKTRTIGARVVKAAVNRGSVKRAKGRVIKTVDKAVDQPESHTSVDETGLSMDIKLLCPPLDD
jgi:hypothetical protein